MKLKDLQDVLEYDWAITLNIGRKSIKLKDYTTEESLSNLAKYKDYEVLRIYTIFDKLHIDCRKGE